MQEILSGHPDRSYQNLWVHPTVFANIVGILKTAGLDSTRRMSIEERVGIFLFIVGLGASNREAQERFQHSGETISRSVI
jgi:chromosome condensin MukBEF MukE localization factor